MLLRAAVDRKQKSAQVRTGPARWLGLRETGSELTTARPPLVRWARRLTRPACICKLPVGSDCPVGLVLARTRFSSRAPA
jgi:hypothetical protein